MCRIRYAGCLVQRSIAVECRGKETQRYKDRKLDTSPLNHIQDICKHVAKSTVLHVLPYESRSIATYKNNTPMYVVTARACPLFRDVAKDVAQDECSLVENTHYVERSMTLHHAGVRLGQWQESVSIRSYTQGLAAYHSQY
jgi:hypothetical protein